MARRLMGKKAGMIQMFDQDGNPIACTVIQATPSVITQVKTKESDGYNAIQLGYDEIITNDSRTIEKRSTKPLLGHYKKASVVPCKYLYENRVDSTDGFEVGQKIDISQFQNVTHLDVVGTSKGKGYQGVMKKYGFRGGPASHGSGFHRHAGSTGMRSTPGRCLPGGPRPSHMGDERVTVESLKVVSVDLERNVVIVRGAVPGAINSPVFMVEAKKAKAKKAKAQPKAAAKKK